jgi:DNA-binding NtrC family response regulator
MAPPARVLLVDDDPDFCEALGDRLRSLGFEVSVADRGSEALRLCREEPPAIVLLDLVLPGMDGMAVLEAIRRSEPDVVVIVITGHGTIARAVEAMKKGAYDFVSKPVDARHLEIVLGKALERQALRDANALLSSELGDRYGAIVGDSPQMREVLDVARRVAPSGATVLLLGESGTGKEVIARAIHRWSRRGDQPFVVVNCVALSEELLESELFGHERGAFTGAHQQKRGKLEVAHGGTVFLDEIGEMLPLLQAKLLRFLEEKSFKRVGGSADVKVDVRVIASTNRSLQEEVKEGHFREDLFYRLNVMAVPLPPLRDRPDDVPLLLSHYVDAFNTEFRKAIRGVEPGALKALQGYRWPGNVRELRNAVERAMLLCEGTVLNDAHFPMLAASETELSKGLTLPPNGIDLEELELSLVVQALGRSGWNQTKAAALLGLNRDQIRYRIEKFKLEKPG